MIYKPFCEIAVKEGKNKDFLSELCPLMDIGDFYQYFSKEI